MIFISKAKTVDDDSILQKQYEYYKDIYPDILLNEAIKNIQGTDTVRLATPSTVAKVEGFVGEGSGTQFVFEDGAYKDINGDEFYSTEEFESSIEGQDIDSVRESIQRSSPLVVNYNGDHGYIVTKTGEGSDVTYGFIKEDILHSFKGTPIEELSGDISDFGKNIGGKIDNQSYDQQKRI